MMQPWHIIASSSQRYGDTSKIKKAKTTKMWSSPFLYNIIMYYPLIFGSSRPRPFFLSTALRAKPRIRAATPRHASITSGAV